MTTARDQLAELSKVCHGMSKSHRAENLESRTTVLKGGSVRAGRAAEEVRIEMHDLVLAHTPQELFELAEAIGSLSIFGPWVQDGSGGWCRPEPNRRPNDSRVFVLEYCGENEDSIPRGWHYRLGFGVLCIQSVSSTHSCASADDAKRIVDRMLLTLTGHELRVVVDPMNDGASHENETTVGSAADRVEPDRASLPAEQGQGEATQR